MEGLAPVKALKDSFLAYPLVNALHILAAFRLLAPGDPGAKGVRTAAKLSAALSMVIWLGVLVAGRFIGFL